jgi:DNA repair photolyase
MEHNSLHDDIDLVGIEVDRALERPLRPCLKGMSLVNVAAGCSFGCLFCPWRHHGTKSRTEIQLRTNLAAVLEKELISRRRAGRLPAGVAVNLSTDSFQPIAPLLAITHEVMGLLLSEGIEVFIQTKGHIPEGFEGLFRAHARGIHVQVCMFSMNENLTSLYEPKAPKPQARLDSIRRLREWGIDVRGRIEPLIPFISDTAGHMEELIRHMRSAGISKTSAAYLILEPQMLESVQGVLPSAHYFIIKGCFKGQPWKKTLLHQVHRMVLEANRDQGYQRLRNIGRKSEMEVTVCACQDPAFGFPCMALPEESLKSRMVSQGQLSLFPTG